MTSPALRMEFVDLKAQYRLLKDEIDAAVQQVLDSARFIMGPEIELLERELADFAGVKHAVGVSSGTDALVIALMALEIGPGDEVITVPFTFAGTVEAIRLVGAEPVFVDIEPAGFNMDPSLLEAALSERTRAVIPVSLFGQLPALEAINEFATGQDLAVIEDAAQSYGAGRDGRRSCAHTTLATTSFFPAKPLGCYGDGGAVFTDDDALARAVRLIRNHGGPSSDHARLGMNGRLDTVQAAILRVKLKHFEAELAERRRIAGRYIDELNDVCETPQILPGNDHIFSQFTLRAPDRDGLAAALRAEGIPTAVYYPVCMHQQPAFADLAAARGSYPVAERAAREVLSLPMHPWLGADDQGRIIEVSRRYLKRNA